MNKRNKMLVFIPIVWFIVGATANQASIINLMLQKVLCYVNSLVLVPIEPLGKQLRSMEMSENEGFKHVKSIF